MRKIAALLLGVMLFLSMGFGTAAHALERRQGIEVSILDSGEHYAADRDQVPTDAEKGYPHHHGVCHDHQIGIPAEMIGSELPSASPVRPVARLARAASLSESDPALRPPRA